MTTAIAKYAAQKMLSKEMDKYKSKKVEGPYVSTLSSTTQPSLFT